MHKYVIVIFYIMFITCPSYGNIDTFIINKGFNFISLTVLPSSSLKSDVLMINNPSINSIFMFDKDTQSFTYQLRLPSGNYFGSIFDIIPGYGYVIKSDSSFSFSINGLLDTVNQINNLKSGFNFVGIESNVNTLAKDLLNTRLDIQSIFRWNSETASFNFIIRLPNNTLFGEDFTIESLKGYFVKSNGNNPIEQKKVSNPTISPVAGIYNGAQTITIYCSTNDATIHYTTDGTEPSPTNGIIYDKPFLISSSTVLKVIASKVGYINSDTLSYSYTVNILQVSAPTISPTSGSYIGEQEISINCQTDGSTIIYTIDGTTPSSSNGSIYSAPFKIASTSSVKAIAIKTGMFNSEVTISSYTLSYIPKLTSNNSFYNCYCFDRFNLSNIIYTYVDLNGSNTMVTPTHRVISGNGDINNNIFYAYNVSGNVVLEAQYNNITTEITINVTDTFNVNNFLKKDNTNDLMFSDGDKLYSMKYLGITNILNKDCISIGNVENNKAYYYYIEDSGYYGYLPNANAFIKISSRFPKNGEITTSTFVDTQNVLHYSEVSCTGIQMVKLGFGNYPCLTFIYNIDNKWAKTDHYLYNVGLARTISESYDQNVMSMTVDGQIYSRKKAWTFLFYIATDDDQGTYYSPSNFFINMINGFSGTALVENFNFVYQLSPSKYFDYGITKRFYNDIEGKLIQTFAYNNEITNNGDANNIKNFLNWSINSFPADNYALFICAHGSGALSIVNRSIGYDRNVNNAYNYDYLSMYEIKDALNYGTTLIGKKFEILTFDSCVMGMLEVATQIKNYTNYFICSEAVAFPFNGNQITEKLNTANISDSIDVSKKIIDAYYDSNNNNITISLIKTSGIDSLLSDVSILKSSLKDDIIKFDPGYLYDCIVNTEYYNSSNFTQCYIDLYNFVYLLNVYRDNILPTVDKTRFLDITYKIWSEKDSVVLYNKVRGFNNSNGLSIYLPHSSIFWDTNLNDFQYKLLDFNNLTYWGDFVTDWVNILRLYGM